MADEQDWDELDGLLRRELSRPARVDPAAVGRIMTEVRTPPPQPAWRAALAWLFRPRPLAVSPFGALAAAAALVALTALATRTTGSRGQRQETAAPPPGVVQNVAQQQQQPPPSTQNVQFVFVNTEASSVSLVGDFNNWDLGATPLRRTGPEGIWSVVVPLPAGEHHYSYVVDGKTWVPDATAPQAPAGELGGTNSVLFVGGRS